MNGRSDLPYCRSGTLQIHLPHQVVPLDLTGLRRQCFRIRRLLAHQHAARAGQYRLHRANKVLEEIASLPKYRVDPLIHAVGQKEVDNSYVRVLLPDSVNSADPLFDLARVPRQVVIDDRSGGLEIQALAGGIRADQDRELPGRKGARNGILRDALPLRTRPDLSTLAAIAAEPLVIVARQGFPKVLHCVGVLGENQGRPAIVRSPAENREEMVPFAVASTQSLQTIQEGIDLLPLPSCHFRIIR